MRLVLLAQGGGVSARLSRLFSDSERQKAHRRIGSNLVECADRCRRRAYGNAVCDRDVGMDPSPPLLARGARAATSTSDITMSSQPFVHLHCHSHYSLLDGASKIPDLIERTKLLGMPAIALTDHGNLYGAVELLREAKAGGIKPIIGLEAYVAPGNRAERGGGGVSGQEHAFHLTLLGAMRLAFEI